jgi:hypothetical protein
MGKVARAAGHSGLLAHLAVELDHQRVEHLHFLRTRRRQPLMIERGDEGLAIRRRGEIE